MSPIKQFVLGAVVGLGSRLSNTEEVSEWFESGDGALQVDANVPTPADFGDREVDMNSTASRLDSIPDWSTGGQEDSESARTMDLVAVKKSVRPFALGHTAA